MTPAPRWGLPLRLVHALSAVLVIGVLAAGLFMVHGASTANLRFTMTQWHKAAGILALVLLAVRIVARLASPVPPDVASGWRRKAAATVHGAVYVLLLVVPLMGWAMASASPLGVPTRLFGDVMLPSIVAPDLATYQTTLWLHRSLAWLLGALVVIHIAGALTHGSATRSVLRRMWSLR